jgi:hypothetical protein
MAHREKKQKSSKTDVAREDSVSSADEKPDVPAVKKLKEHEAEALRNPNEIIPLLAQLQARHAIRSCSGLYFVLTTVFHHRNSLQRF